MEFHKKGMVRKGYQNPFLWALFSGLCLASLKVQAGDPFSDISRAWKNREEKVLSLDCEWSGQHIFGAKTLVYHDKEGKEFFLPENDFICSQEFRFRLDGSSKMRYEFTGWLPVEQTRKFEPRYYVSITDAKDQKCYYGKDQSTGEPRYPPYGFINKGKRLPEAPGIHLRPLLTLYRPSCPEIAPFFDFSKFSQKGQVTHGGRECLLLEKTERGVAKCELVIDMKRDCVPVRIQQFMHKASNPDGNWLTTTLVEINYVEKTDGTWSPASWKTAIFKDGAMVIEQISAIVKKIEVNVRLPEADFRFKFPVGTFVLDQKTKERYILKEGEDKRYVTQAEMDARAPYIRLLATRTGEAVENIPRFPFWWLVIIGIFLLFLVGWYIQGALFRKKKGEIPSP